MKRVGLIVLGVLLLAIAGVLLFSRTAPAPKYQAHTADYWLDCIFPQGRSGATQSEALNAFHAMGTNALPFLLQNLERPDSSAAKIHTSLYQHSPPLLRKLIPTPHYASRQSAAELILLNLRETSNAVPNLVELAKRSSGHTRQLVLSVLLNRIQPDHPEYASVFVPALTDTNASCRYIGVQLLTDLDNHSSNVVLSVSNILNDTDDVVRISAAYAVWKLSGDTHATVAVLKEELRKSSNSFKSFSPYYRAGGDTYKQLIFHHLFDIDSESPVVADYFRERLRSPNAADRHNACVELLSLHSQARFLTSDISPLLNDPDESVRKAAREALLEIKPRHLFQDMHPSIAPKSPE